MLPTNTKLVNNWMLPSERATANGLWLAAMMMGIFIGSPLSSYIITNWGWRSVFYIFAILGIVVGLLTPLIVKSKPEDSHRVSQEELSLIKISITEFNEKQAKALGTTKVGIASIITDPWVWVLMFIYFFSALLFWANVTWLPTYFVKGRGTNLMSAGLLAGLPYLVAVFGASLGFFSDKLTKGWRTPWLIACTIITIPMVFISVNAQSLALSLVGFCVSTFFNWGLVTLCYTIPMELWTREKVASVAGFMLTGGSIAGILSPSIAGYFLDLTGSFKAPYYIFAGATAVACVLAIALYFRERKVREQLAA
jgi:sugar phosphate permease